MKKKLLAALLSAALLLGAVGCAPTAADPTPTPETETTPAPTEAVDQPEEQEEPQNEQYDIVVAGAGAAGMMAAINAYEHGARNILVVEKQAVVGGGTAAASGGMHACDTKVMQKFGYEETMVDMFETAVRRGVGLGQTEIYGLYIGAATDFVNWLIDCGYDFWDIIYGDLHKPSDGSMPGASLAAALYDQLSKRGIEVRLNSPATRLVTDEDGRISGVAINGPDGEYTVDCTAVVLATGGFASNFDMVVENDPTLAGIHMGNCPACTGDGIRMAQELGAQICNMNLYKISNAASVHNIAYAVPDAALALGAVYVNANGERFANETAIDTATILAQPGSEYYAIYNESIYQTLLSQQEELGWYDYYPLKYFMQSDYIIKAGTIEELAGLIGVDATALQTTVDTLSDDAFGSDAVKQGAASWAEGPYYAAQQTVGINHTLGGLVIDSSGRVYNEQNTPIFGLYAGGEVVGNAQGGDYYFGLMDAVVMGGVCGENAVYYVMDHGGLTEHQGVQGGQDQTVQPETTGDFTDGTYTGEGSGNNSTIKVEVTVEGGSIVSIEVLEQAETPVIFAGAVNEFIPSIIRTQDLEVDACSGATNSCNGIREAVKNALGR